MNPPPGLEHRLLSVPLNDEVKRDSIHVDTVRREQLCTQRLASLGAQFHINPHRK